MGRERWTMWEESQKLQFDMNSQWRFFFQGQRKWRDFLQQKFGEYENPSYFDKLIDAKYGL